MTRYAGLGHEAAIAHRHPTGRPVPWRRASPAPAGAVGSETGLELGLAVTSSSGGRVIVGDVVQHAGQMRVLAGHARGRSSVADGTAPLPGPKSSRAAWTGALMLIAGMLVLSLIARAVIARRAWML